jgi:hypothetical protein
MDSVVNQNGKYIMYDINSRYLGLRETESFRTTNMPATRFVNFDWKKAIKNIEKASVCESGTVEPTNWLNYEKKNNVEISQQSQQQVVEYMDESQFWSYINQIRCCDKDEGRMTKNNICLSSVECQNILMSIDDKYIPELKISLTNIPIMDGIPSSDYCNLLTHIIAKGKPFYNGIIENPMVSLYLCDQFYPVYTWINQLAGNSR